MKTLVVYYTRTGITRKLAQAITEALGCDIEEIVDAKDRRGVMGYILAGRDATQKARAQIKPADKKPGDYDLVVIGTPVWAATMSAAVRSYIEDNKAQFKKVALFCTMGGSGAQKTSERMEELCGQKAVASMSARSREVSKDLHKEAVKEFAGKIQTSKN